MQTGHSFPIITKTITQELLQEYAQASGDFNPLHIDPAYGATTQFRSTIAHGMLYYAYASEMMSAAFGLAWASSPNLRVRFRAPARPGDRLRVDGRVQSRSDEPGGQVVLRCTIECRNQQGNILASGEASVKLELAPPGPREMQ